MMPVYVAFFFLVLSALPQAGSELTPAFKSQYIDKTLLFREPIAADELHYEGDGKMADSKERGPWTVYGTLLVKGIGIKDTKVRIWGSRIMASFDDSKKKIGYFRTDQTVSVWIEFGRKPTESDITEAVKVIFLGPNESRADFVPSYWRRYLTSPQPQMNAPLRTPGMIRVGPGVAVGNLKFKKQPIYPNSAKAFRVTGVVSLNVVIDATGTISKVEIAVPAGAGLDEAAIEAVREWKYKPYYLNGSPVDVETIVTVSFQMGG